MSNFWDLSTVDLQLICGVQADPSQERFWRFYFVVIHPSGLHFIPFWTYNIITVAEAESLICWNTESENVFRRSWNLVGCRAVLPRCPGRWTDIRQSVGAKLTGAAVTCCHQWSDSSMACKQRVIFTPHCFQFGILNQNELRDSCFEYFVHSAVLDYLFQLTFAVLKYYFNNVAFRLHSLS